MSRYNVSGSSNVPCSNSVMKELYSCNLEYFELAIITDKQLLISNCAKFKINRYLYSNY